MIIIYWNNLIESKCEYEIYYENDEYVYFEDYAKNHLRLNKTTNEVDIYINQKWEVMNNGKVIKWSIER